MQHIQYLAFGVKFLPTADLFIPALQHCIHHIYPTLGTPTMLSAIDFHYGSVLNAVHSVSSFLGQNPHSCWSSPAWQNKVVWDDCTCYECICIHVISESSPTGPLLDLTCLLLLPSLTAPQSYTQPPDVLVYTPDKCCIFSYKCNIVWFSIGGPNNTTKVHQDLPYPFWQKRSNMYNAEDSFWAQKWPVSQLWISYSHLPYVEGQ